MDLVGHILSLLERRVLCRHIGHLFLQDSDILALFGVEDLGALLIPLDLPLV